MNRSKWRKIKRHSDYQNSRPKGKSRIKLLPPRDWRRLGIGRHREAPDAST